MRHKVLIMRCDEYDASKIAGILKDGMAELGVKPTGRTLLKPNCVVAHPELFSHAATAKEFLEGAIVATKEMGTDIRDLVVAERSGITIPTRYSFKSAGYLPIVRKHGLNVCYLDEARHVPVALTHPDSLRPRVLIPRAVTECDFLVNLPKFKAHPWTRLTLSLKNFIGLQDDRHRLVDHNSFLEHKIADLQEVIQPGFIAVDAIVAGQKMMLTPTPFPMGAIVMGTNSCAVDTVGCHMVHVEPRDLKHLAISSQRGYGPMALDEIEVDGDFPLEEVRENTRKFQFCFERVDTYFGPEAKVRCTVGTFPESHSPDYCWGGCPGALQEAVHIMMEFYPDLYRRMSPIRYVVGKVEGPLDLTGDERVLFVGDCTSWEGELDGKRVSILPGYRTASEVDEARTRSNDMLRGMAASMINCLRNRSSRYLHVRGCPVSVGAHVNYLSFLGKVPNVNLDPRNVVPVNVAYLQMRGRRLWNRLVG